MRALASIAALGALLSAAACAHYSQEDGERLQNEVYALQTQVTAVQQAITELQAEKKKQGQELAKLTTEVAQLNQAARRNDADLGVQLDETMQQVAKLRGFVESSGERLSTMESAVNKVQEELDLRFQNLQETQRVESIKSQTEKEKAIADARKHERLLSEPSALFEEVERMMKGGSPGDARKLLREFTIRAKSERGLQKHLPDAHYLIGETFLAEGNYQQAAAEYNGVRKNHSKSPKVPDALFKLGTCFEKLNLPDDAKLFYQTIVQKYPKSSVARDAKGRLDALK